MPPGEKSNKAVMRRGSCFAFHFVSGLSSRLHSKYVHVQSWLPSVLGVTDIFPLSSFLIRNKIGIAAFTNSMGSRNKAGTDCGGNNL